MIIEQGQYRNAASGHEGKDDPESNCVRPTRRYRVTVLTLSNCGADYHD